VKKKEKKKSLDSSSPRRFKNGPRKEHEKINTNVHDSSAVSNENDKNHKRKNKQTNKKKKLKKGDGQGDKR